MKPIPSIIKTVVTSAVVFTLLSFALPNLRAFAASQGAAQDAPENPAQSAACDSSRSVQVSGTAVVNVTPDRALVQLGVQSNGATVREVEAANTAATQAVIRALRGAGIEAKDIATDQYVIEPLYSSWDSLVIKGYRTSNVVAVTVRDVSRASAIVSTALEAGANQVVNVEFYTSELRQYRDQAREMAMTAAREKAQALASAAGSTAGCVINISENSSSSFTGWWWYGRSQNQALWTQNVMVNAPSAAGEMSASGDEPISLGMIAVRAEIAATFGLE